LNNYFPIIDLFAGPGGLGEGFSAFTTQEKSRPFRIGLSIEKDYYAHKTLQLRSFFRQFTPDKVPEDYYSYLRGNFDFSLLKERYPVEMDRARNEAWQTELGVEDPKIVDEEIIKALNGTKRWVLIGGPPCQAYSLVGRSRNGGTKPEDARLYLYREYLRIIAQHSPSVFVMENVKGLLSSRIYNELIFDKILSDLRRPCAAIKNSIKKSGFSTADNEYNLFSLVNESSETASGWKELDPRDFIIKSEEYGIPQARHRVIILGIRKDLSPTGADVLTPSSPIDVKTVLAGLPSLRSGLSKTKDSAATWKNAIQTILNLNTVNSYRDDSGSQVLQKIKEIASNLCVPEAERGSDFIFKPAGKLDEYSHWYLDHRMCGICNHSTRGHIVKDLHRYLFAACYARVHERSPTLHSFPKELLPHHRNVEKAILGGHFEDRFRVQVESRPSTTITSHIAKDGHYYIHPDPSQCRSLTVREAARLQTFPDNYFFEGPRTEQYKQVGNAVPPLLARQIARVVYDVLQAG
jgi:DNA (cytosine-5)-methyltransferase 1